MAAKRGDRTRAVFGFVGFHIIGARRLDRVAHGQLIDHQHGADRQEGALHVFAAYPQEVCIGHAVGLVELARIAALFERFLRQGGRRTRAGDEHRVGLGGNGFEHLAGHRGVRAGIALVHRDLDVLERCRLAEFLKPALAVGIRKADEGDGLDPTFCHVVSDRHGHHDVVLGRLEDPAFFGVLWLHDTGRGGH